VKGHFAMVASCYFFEPTPGAKICSRRLVLAFVRREARRYGTIDLLSRPRELDKTHPIIIFERLEARGERQEDGENLLRGNGGRLLLPQRIVGDPCATRLMHFSHQINFASPKEISSVSFSHKEFPLKLGFTSRR
jgi:hypothetical protein